MSGYLVFLQVRSAAPPVIALTGLLGMVLGEQAIDGVRHHFVRPPAQTSAGRLADDTSGPITEGPLFLTAPFEARALSDGPAGCLARS